MDVSSGTRSLPESISQFEFEDSPTWSLIGPDGGTITSPTSGSDEGNGLQVNDHSDIDEVPRKKQKTQTRNAVLAKSHRNERYTLVDYGSRKSRPPRLQNIVMPTALTVDSADALVTTPTKTSLLAVEKKAEPSSTTSIFSYIQIERSNRSPTNPNPTTIISAKTAPIRDPSVKEETSNFTPSRKRTNGLLAPRPSEMSKSTSTSDSINSEALKDCKEPPRKSRGLGLRPTDSSSGAKLKKSQNRIANQDELELWTNADVAHITFRRPDGLIDKFNEEYTRRSVSYILTSLTEMEAERSNEDVARNERTMSNGAQNQVAMPESSIYTRCEDLVEEIFGSNTRGKSLLKPKTVPSFSSTLSLN